MDELAATTKETAVLMEAFIPLVQARQYGNVRNFDVHTLTILLESIFARVKVGLPNSAVGIDATVGKELSGKIEDMSRGVLLLDEEGMKEEEEAGIPASRRNAARGPTTCFFYSNRSPNQSLTLSSVAASGLQAISREHFDEAIVNSPSPWIIYLRSAM